LVKGCVEVFGGGYGGQQGEDAHNEELANKWVCNDVAVVR